MSDLRDKLKPCPFCGTVPIIWDEDAIWDPIIWDEDAIGDEDDPKCMRIGCDNEECPVDICSVSIPGKEKVIEAWNTRAALAQPEAVEPPDIQRAMDMLGDVPGNTILERVERIVSWYLALQCELEKARTTPPLAPGVERMRRALENVKAAILEADPEVVTDTLWLPARISPNETVVDHIDLALSRADEGKESEGDQQQDEVARTRVWTPARSIPVDKPSQRENPESSTANRGSGVEIPAPTPRDQREAIARVIAERIEVSGFAVNNFELADAILALQTRAGG